MKIIVHKWEKIEDVPLFLRNWAEYVAEQQLNLEEIKELVGSYENYLNSQDDIEIPDSTIVQ